MDRLEDSQTPGCLGEQEASRGVVDTSRPPFEWGRNVEILSQHKHYRHCPKRSQTLKEAEAPVPGAFFLGCGVPGEYTCTSVLPSSPKAFLEEITFAVPNPRKF